jgi:hypothetical protein
MTLTILPSDNFCSVNGAGLHDDLTSCSVPANIWALQWDGTSGHIEFTDKNNEEISTLPSWATACADTTASRLAAIQHALDNPTDEDLAVQHRGTRNFLLQNSDWVVTKALEAGDSVPSAWVTYRTALRNITNHSNWPNLTDGDWPVEPS